MLGLVIIVLLVCFGFTARKLTWVPFLCLIPISLVATWFQTARTIDGGARLGEDAAYMWEPDVFAVNAGFAVILWSAFYLAGYGAGWMVRRRREKK